MAGQAAATAAAIESELLALGRIADHLVERCMSWWDLAARIDGVSDSRREAFREDAIATLRREFPREIETTGRTHVLWAIA